MLMNKKLNIIKKHQKVLNNMLIILRHPAVVAGATIRLPKLYNKQVSFSKLYGGQVAESAGYGSQVKKTNFWEEKINIENIKIPRFMSAPMDGVTDSPTRQLIRLFSPEILLFTEMRHVASIVNKKNDLSLKYNPVEHPICFQISANSTNFIKEAVEKILNKKFDMINLNAGCPARKVIGSNSGSSLMGNMPLLEKIILSLQKAINKQIPITLKIRSGFKEKNALEISKLAQDLGISCLIIHPRLQSGGFSSSLDFELVKKIKETIKIPVIFSGNINSFENAKKTHQLTNVDGFMIGRSLYGCPWKIREIMENSKGNSFSISTKKSLTIALKHLKLNSEYYGKKTGFQMIKKHIIQYVKYLPASTEIRKNLVLCKSEQEMENIFKDLLSKI